MVSMMDEAGGFLTGGEGSWCVLGEVTDFYVLGILIGVDFKYLFYNFYNGRTFLKGWKEGKGCDILRCSRGLSGYGRHLNRDALIGKYQSNKMGVFFQGWNELLYFENLLGNLI